MYLKSIDEKKLERICMDISQKIFFKYIKPQRSDLKLDTMFAFGSASFTGTEKEIQQLLNKIKFVFAKGIYMDSERRSYFSPDEIILEKTIEMKDLA